MSLTPSTMMPLGTKAPDFALPDTVSGKTVTLPDVAGDKATVVMFICNHCPYVLHVKDELVRIAERYLSQGVGFVAISSNDISTHPQDAPDKMKAFAAANNFPFAYLYDESQAVAKAYDAACTPDFYVFDAALKCAYRGQMDGARPGNNESVTGADLRASIDSILEGDMIPEEAQTPSQGCNIKWKA